MREKAKGGSGLHQFTIFVLSGLYYIMGYFLCMGSKVYARECNNERGEIGQEESAVLKGTPSGRTTQERTTAARNHRPS